MINQIRNENCLDTMKRMDADYIDLTVTSPPYDNLRDYNGYVFDFEPIARELYRVTKPGGVVVWIVNDATINGSETGTSFKQALYFKECGFRLHDTMIWNKGSFTAVGALFTRYAPVFEYMFVLAKGKPNTFNPIKDRKNIHAGTMFHGNVKQIDGTMLPVSGAGKKKYHEHGQRFNIWQQPTEKNAAHIYHPAQFPEQIAHDHIISWSNVGDLIYDPFMGSGTTAKMALLARRDYIGSEISSEYCELIHKRLSKSCPLFYKPKEK